MTSRTCPAPYPEDALREWIVGEQATLWHALDRAIRRAMNGCWSIEAGGIASRIVEAARLVGATPPDSVPWTVLAGGVYAAVLDAGQVAYREPADDEWAGWDETMSEYGGTRATLLAAYAGTVAAIRTPRETAFINGDEW